MKGIAAGVAVALLVAACVAPGADSGTGADANPGALSCAGAHPYGGAPLHAALPASYFAASVGGVTPGTPVPADLAALLDQELADILRKTGAPAITAALDLPGAGQWSRTLGLARTGPTEQAATSATLFHWGSVAKAITATLVLQLVEQGKLRLDDHLALWFPQMPQAEHITLAHLLTHTSGLATNALDVQGQIPPSLAELLHAAARTPSVSCPGAAASYSNTGYLMLGLVVQAVTGEPFDQALQHRIAQTLGLQQLRALRPDQDGAPDLATPHRGREPQADPGVGSRVGSGNVVATAQDMLQFWRALHTGRLLASTTVQQQWALLYPMANGTPAAAPTATMWFGQGVMLTQWQDAQGRGRDWLAHLGGTGSANAVVAYDPLVQAYAAVAVNSEVSSVAVANALYTTVLAWRSKESSARHAMSPQILQPSTQP